MKFSDILNMPLPSQANSDEKPIQESAEDMDDTSVDTTSDAGNGTAEEGCCGSEKEGCDNSSEGCGDTAEDVIDPEVGEINDDVDSDDVSDIADDDGIDPDELSDDELMALDRELSDDAVDSAAGADDDDDVTLDPDEEIKADSMMSMAATSLLLNDELNAEEKAAFVENNAEVTTAINEGFMTDSDAAMLASNAGVVTEGKYNKKMIIRLDAESKKKQLYALAVNVSAAAKHDPDYIKLKKVMKMRKILRAKLERKYHAEATKRMKIYFKRLSNSNSSTLSKIGKKHSK